MAASLPSMTVNSHRGLALYICSFTAHWLSLLTKAFRWDISAVSSCSFEKWFVNCHFELLPLLTTTWHLRQANHKPCIYTSRSIWALSPVSETIHSSYTEFVRRHGINSWSCLASQTPFISPIPCYSFVFMYKSCLVLKRKNLTTCFHSG